MSKLTEQWSEATGVSSKLNRNDYYRLKVLEKGTEVKTMGGESFLLLRTTIIEGIHEGTWMTAFLRLDNLDHLKRFELAMGLDFSEAMKLETPSEVLEAIKELVVFQEFCAKPYMGKNNVFNGEQRYNISSFAMFKNLPAKKISTDV